MCPPTTHGKIQVLGHLKTRLFTIKVSKNVGLGGPWYIIIRWHCWTKRLLTRFMLMNHHLLIRFDQIRVRLQCWVSATKGLVNQLFRCCLELVFYFLRQYPPAWYSRFHFIWLFHAFLRVLAQAPTQSTPTLLFIFLKSQVLFIYNPLWNKPTLDIQGHFLRMYDGGTQKKHTIPSKHLVPQEVWLDVYRLEKVGPYYKL